MSDYDRNTVLPVKRVLEIADDVLTTKAGLSRKGGSHHRVSYTGEEGDVAVDAHRHGAMTTVTVRTNQLRTSKVDTVVRHFLNQLPYQPGDPGREY